MEDSVQEYIREYLEAFDRNPSEAMNRQPPKFDAEGSKRVPGATLFAEGSINAREYVIASDQFRQQVDESEESATAKAPIDVRSDYRGLVDEFKYAGLEIMEREELTSATLGVSPWSDTYWPLYKGVLGNRYADLNFPADTDWKRNASYVQQHPASGILSTGNSTAIDSLSPSEKYDALVGDRNGTLTHWMWSEGEFYHDRFGTVEQWFGICHGWAAASYMLNRPTNRVSVVASDGTPITFFPSDIKGLASLLWAQSCEREQTRSVGGRCRVKDPELDPETGRIVSKECFDTNPGTWHLAVVNQIGASGRSMVMDATYDYEVWNQPIKAYDYRYFNPQSNKPVDSLAEATVRMSDFNDRFGKYRSEEASAVVGIMMHVVYMVETEPTHNSPDAETPKDAQSVLYLYDVELDEAERIVGGEWYNNRHPDFLWTPPLNERVVTVSDHQVSGGWDPQRPLPDDWQGAGRESARKEGAPLAAIVEHLIDLANA